jgi:hypothetical protein
MTSRTSQPQRHAKRNRERETQDAFDRLARRVVRHSAEYPGHQPRIVEDHFWCPDCVEVE